MPVDNFCVKKGKVELNSEESINKQYNVCSVVPLACLFFCGQKPFLGIFHAVALLQ
jgi:hypothetical protein